MFNNEQVILGKILDNPDNLILAQEKGITPDHFLVDLNKKIFSLIVEMDKQNQPFDGLSVSLKATEKGIVKTPAAVFELSEASMLTSNAEYHIDEIIEAYKLDKYKHALLEVTGPLARNDISSDQVAAALDSANLDVQKDQDSKVSGAKSLANSLMGLLERVIEGDGFGDISTGFSDLDYKATFHPNDLIIVAGRPGMGKTALALNMVLNILKAGKKCLVFSLEMNKDQITSRIISMLARVDAKGFRTGEFTEDESDRLVHGISDFASKFNGSFFVDDTPGITLEKIRARSLAVKKTSGLDCLVIDYLQIMGSSQKEHSRERELAVISGGLKALAKELDLPVIALCQINRNNEKRPDKRPVLSDLRESGSIEQDADIVMMIHRENQKEETEIIYTKNRHGELGTSYLSFDGRRMQFKGTE